MKHFLKTSRRHRQAGAALITVCMVSVCTAMLLGASLTVALTSTQLGWSQANSEAALELADAGVNSELNYVALNLNATTQSGKSSQPVAYSGVTAEAPNTSTPVKGRPGTVTGYSGGTYYVYSSMDAAGTQAWDGVTSPYYITAHACVGESWQMVQVQASSSSLFNVYGIFALGDSSSTPTVTVNSGSTVSITGSAGLNGTVSQSGSCQFTAPCAINANCSKHSSGQLTSSNLCSGGYLCSQQAPIVYPRTATCCGTCFGCASGSSDATCFSACKTQCCNSSCVYTYNNNAWNSTINTNNCCKLSGGCGNQLTSSCWNNAGYDPSTYTSQGWWWGDPATQAAQTLIFEPGDYYFTSMQLAYDCTKEFIVDPCAYASGGTPGQVRFWFYDPNSATDGNPADSCCQQITNTCASGSSTPDPGQFRIYYGKDNCTCNFQRPNNVTAWTGYTLTGDFNLYCGVYACTKQATDTSSLCGTNCCFQGCAASSGCSGQPNTSTGGRCNLCGSMLSDHCQFSGCCNLNYTQSQCCTKDPCCGATCSGWSCNGG